MIALLRRHRGFRLLWTGETTSQFGNSVTTVVIPLIAVTTLHAGAFTVSLLKAAAWLPWLAIGLLAGAWIDQLSAHRRLMIVCDLAAAAPAARSASECGGLTACPRAGGEISRRDRQARAGRVTLCTDIGRFPT